MPRFSSTIPLLSLATLLVACRHDKGDDGKSDIRFSRNAGAGSAKYVMQPGDLRIVTVDGAVDLALLGDTISSGLSQKNLDKVKRETDTSAVEGSGFGASIEKMVKGTVQSAIGTRVAFPISALKDVRNDGGKIVFAWNGKSQEIFSHSNVNGKNVLESFSPADAQGFVDAVRARMRARGQF